MVKFGNFKYNVSKIIALTEKNIKLSLRFKYSLIIGFISPIINILLPLIILNVFLDYNPKFGPWTKYNFFLYQFIAYNISLLKSIIGEYPSQFYSEKYWKTFPALIIAPSNRLNLLLGIFFSRLILISMPCSIFFIVSYIYYPISFITLFFVILIFFLIALIFSGMGLILGIFAVSNENIWNIINFILNIFFIFSCITYPFELFTKDIQNIINLNPLYYLFDILRLVWIEDNVIISVSSHIFHFFILILNVIIFPATGTYIFKIIYKKYGIVGA